MLSKCQESDPLIVWASQVCVGFVEGRGGLGSGLSLTCVSWVKSMNAFSWVLSFWVLIDMFGTLGLVRCLIVDSCSDYNV